LSSAVPRNINVKDDASDAYVDALLANLRDYIASTPGLDPADLPEGEVSFSQEVGFITFHGSARVYDGFFRGLSTIHRTGGTDLSIDGTKISLTANIGINDATAGYSAHAEFMGVGVGASADIKISSVSVAFNADTDLGGDCKLNLKSFDITNIGNIDINIHGLGPLDWILGTVVGFIADLIRGFLDDILEGPIKDALANVLANIDIPLPGCS